MNLLELNFIIPQLKIVSSFLDIKFILIATIVIPAIYLFYKRYRMECVLLLVATSAYPYVLLLKAIFKLPRPPENDLSFFLPWDVYGFPSGHVVIYTAFWGFLLFLTFHTHRIGKTVRKLVQWICIYFLVFVGASRVGLGAHYVRDVVFGYIFGVVFLTGLIFLYGYLKYRRNSVAKD